MVNDDGGGGGGGGGDGGTGGNVSVNINGMLDFYLAMQLIPGDANEANITLAELTPLIQTGLNTPGHLGEVFPEGAQWAAIMLDRQHQFTSFMADVTNGIFSIASASAVVAEMYGDGDFHSGVDINEVAFAFGDRDATSPDGFRADAQTLSEWRASQYGGAYPLALMGDRSSAKHYSPAGGVDIYMFSDGSSIQTITTTRADGTRVTETTIYGPPVTTAGAPPTRGVIEQSTVESRTRSDGSEVETTAVHTGTEQDGSTSTTVRETASDGTITITNSTSTVVGGGEPIKTESDPVVVRPGEHTVEVEPGPMEEAQETLDSRGTDYYQQQFGYRP